MQAGKVTLAGLRSSSVAKTITEASAYTNLYPDIVDLFIGGAAAFEAPPPPVGSSR